jgi:O-antigen/teichoic acid export membrane protein
MSSLKSTVIYLPGLLIPRAMSLALVIVMTHFLPKTDYGLLTLVITVGELVDTSLTTWVRLALLRLGSGGTITTDLAAVVLRTVALTTSFGCLVSLGIAWFLIRPGFLPFWIAVASYTLGISLLRFGLALLQLNNRSVTYSVLEIARALLSFGLATGAASLIGAQFLYPSLAVSVTTFAFALVAIRRGLQGLQPGITHYRIRDITAFAGPLLVLSVLTIVANAMDRLFLQYYWAAAAVASYAATYALARQPVDVLANAINTGGYPALVVEYDKGGPVQAAAFLRGQLGFFLKLVAPVIAVLFLVRADVIATLLPRAYHTQAQGLFGPILLAATAFNLRSSIFDNVFLVERRNSLQLRYFVPVFLIGVAVAFVTVPMLGATGSALVFVTWTTLALLMSAVMGRRLIPITIAPADVARAVALVAVSCLLAGTAALALPASRPFVRLLAEGFAAAVGYSVTLMALYPKHMLHRLRRMHYRLVRPAP